MTDLAEGGGKMTDDLVRFDAVGLGELIRQG